MKRKILIVGSISNSISLYSEGEQRRFGGLVMYAGIAALRLGLKTYIITIGNSDAGHTDSIHGGILQLKEEGGEVHCDERETSNNFSNDYRGERILRMRSIIDNEPVRKEAMHKFLPEYDALLFGPLLNEISHDIFKMRLSKTQMLDAQGFVRKATLKQDGYYYISHEEWDSCEDYLPHVDILKISDEEIDFVMPKGNTLEDKCALLSGKGPKVIIVTSGKKGSYVYCNNKLALVPVYDTLLKDPGGAGDVFDVGFLYAYMNGRTPVESAAFGNAAASLKVEQFGQTGIGNLNKVEERYKEIIRKMSNGKS